jgi:hypothetical protein
MGLEFAGAALVLGAIGYYIDWQAGTFPVGLIVGLVLGVIGGMYRFLREAVLASRQNMQRYERQHQARDRARGAGSSGGTGHGPAPGADEASERSEAGEDQR